MKDTYQQENANPRKDCICRRKGLKVNIRTEILHEKYNVIFTSPAPCPMVAENAYMTFTVGVTHFVSPSSLFLDLLDAGT